MEGMGSAEDAMRTLWHYNDELEHKFNVKRIEVLGLYPDREGAEGKRLDVLVEFAGPIGLEFVDLVDYIEDLLGVKAHLLTYFSLDTETKGRIRSEDAREKGVSQQILLDVIKGAMRDINGYIRDLPHGFTDFWHDHKTVDAVLWNLDIISEAAGRIPEEVRSEYPQVAWNSLEGIGKIISHQYLGLDLRNIWHIIETELPEIHALIEEIDEGPFPEQV
jgi:uncharacterized protein with HEPN domain/predicted nucleotidyltransferase